MRNRRAFTLLELIVSIAVGGIIALLVYASASAGIDTRDALDRHRGNGEAELRARIVLADALRHASDEFDPGGSAFELTDATDARGLPTDQLTFLTRGILPPLGASARWAVTLAPTPAGLLIRSVPATNAVAQGISGVLGDVRGMNIEVMGMADRSWSTQWPASGQLPAAVRLTFLDARGVELGAPLVVRVGLEGVR